MSEIDAGSDAGSAASSPAPVETVDILSTLSASDRAAWRETGVFPPDGPAESSPAEPAEQAASTDASNAPASEPGQPAKERKHANADTRIQELLADRAQARSDAAQLRERLDRLERERPAPDAAAASSPATPSKAEWERYRTHPDAPKPSDFEDQPYEDYVAALSVFVADQRHADRERRTRMESEYAERAQAITKNAASAQQRLDAYRQAHPDFESKVHPQLLEIVPASLLPPGTRPGPHNVLAQAIVDSEVGPQLMEHFSTPEGTQEWVELMTLSPANLLRRFGIREARFLTRDTASSTPRPPKTITDAPAPPTTLGRKPADPADDVTGAVARGDYLQYRATLNAREAAAAQGR